MSLIFNVLLYKIDIILEWFWPSSWLANICKWYMAYGKHSINILSIYHYFRIFKKQLTHSSTLAWKIPWMLEPGRLQSMGLLGVRQDWAASLSLFTFMHWRRKWQPTLVFLLGESQGQGAWWAAIYGVVQSHTQLKQLSSSSSIGFL